MGGRGSGRWKRFERFGGSFKTARQDAAMRLDVREVLTSASRRGLTNLGLIRWDRRPMTAYARDGRRLAIERGTLEVHESLANYLPIDQYVVMIARGQHGFMQRAWLYCPSCARPRRTLFVWRVPSLQCRTCAKLAYPSQRLTPRKRAALRRDKAARRINWLWDSGKRPPERPKGQHRKRYACELARWHAENERATDPIRRRVANPQLRAFLAELRSGHDPYLSLRAQRKAP